ncbi:MAG: hypothetical protein M1834_002367 [Cirrosporium novae-zelandiae]|nr:MAG: hypothetical protein M1834_002367 [Cirrosporium novae-zelandiae]
MNSKLLHLPYELRDLIWDFLFSSTTLKWGEIFSDRITSVHVQPAPNSLAVLQTCRQIHNETRDLWLKLVLFEFTHVVFLLDKFAPLPLSVLSRIRRARVGSAPLMLLPPDYDDDVFYRLGNVLTMVPGMQLDTLEVDGSPSFESEGGDNLARDQVLYSTITSLIGRSNGWNTLRVFIPRSTTLGWKCEQALIGEPYYKRAPQPASWNRILEERDGKDSVASVKIYRAKTVDNPADYFEGLTFESFKQEESKGCGFEYAAKEDPFLMSSKERGKNMLIVARRGKKANIVETIGDSTREYDVYDIREWAGDMPWAEVKRVAGYDFSDSDDEISMME